jgi:uncharacterized membrane protein YbhN (UPF0104 family)
MLAALAVAVLVSVIVVERHTLAESLHVLARLNWAWFLLAVASEGVSLASFGLSRRQLMRVDPHRRVDLDGGARAPADRTRGHGRIT